MSQEAEDIFTEAWEMTPGERARFLDEACGGDASLRRSVEELFSDARQAENYFTTGIARRAARASDPIPGEKEGDQVGPYKLLQKIGEGGFGVVWMAEQKRPIARKVAVKIVKAGMDTREVLARFDAERQALARMEHTHIARVLDAGATAAGRPFFAMELVKGMPITRFCDEEKLDTKQRLGLFIDVCSAVHHAHQKGVIHRDLKPSNVLVTLSGDKPTVKVIDFGIAKATQGKLTENTLFTRIEQIVGTPTYMSPEQAGLGSLDIDTRSDIYSLGVLLYEMLAGVPPFDQKTLLKAGYDEMRRIIREVDPPKPSSRVTTLAPDVLNTIAEARKLTPDRLGKLIRSELDWVVMKAMDKARDNRYDSADALALDILRYLGNEPVLARPPGGFYILRKLAARHRAALLVASGFILLLTGATVSSSILAIRAQEAEKNALQRLAEAQAATEARERAKQEAMETTDFLSDVFQRPYPEMDGREVTVVSALEAAEKRLLENPSTSNESRVRMLDILGKTYEQLGVWPRSLEIRYKAYEALRNIPEQDRNEDLNFSILLDIHRMATIIGRYEEARLVGEDALAKFPEKLKGDGGTVLRFLLTHAECTFRSGRHAEAIPILVDAWERMEKAGTVDAAIRTEVAETLASFCKSTRKDSLALAVLGDAHPSREKPPPPVSLEERERRLIAKLEINRARLEKLQSAGKPSAEWIDAMDTVSRNLHSLGRLPEAVANQEKAVQLSREIFGETHSKTISLEESLIGYYAFVCRWDDVNALKAKVGKSVTNYLDQGHADMVNSRLGKAFDCFIMGQYEEGMRITEENSEIARRVFGPASRSTIQMHANHARMLITTGRTQDGYHILMQIGEYMPDDTFIHLLLASLQCWFQRQDDYEVIRRRMLDFARPYRETLPAEAQILDRNVLISCIAPFSEKEQAAEVLESLRVADQAWLSPLCRRRELFQENCRWQTRAIAEYRAGMYVKALESLERTDQLTGTPGTTTTPEFLATNICYKAMILHALGKTEEAKTELAKVKSQQPRPTILEHPLKGINAACGYPMVFYLAYREARKIVDGVDEPIPAMPKPEKTPVSVFD